MTIINTKTGKARIVAPNVAMKLTKNEVAYDPALQIYDPIEKRVIVKVKPTRQEVAELRAEVAALRQRVAALEAAKT